MTENNEKNKEYSSEDFSIATSIQIETVASSNENSIEELQNDESVQNEKLVSFKDESI